MRDSSGSSHALQTDLYQLTMAAAYYEQGHNPLSTFELFVRKLPKARSYLICAGLEEILRYLENLQFTQQEIDFLRQDPTFAASSPDFFEMLQDLRFEGEVRAVAEGTVVFPNEPLLQITAPLIQAQLVETYLLSMLNFSTMVATKASRVVSAAQEKSVLEFGTRRAHGPSAGLLAARAAYIGGCTATSNVQAGYTYDIPISGTSAHSFIMSFESELEAFKAYQKTFPQKTILLIDTYDTIEGAKLVTTMEKPPQGVRLDSGNLTELSFQVRDILDKAGLKETQIVVSSDLNEYKIAEMLQAGAPIDAFGVGTDLSTVRDAPALSGVYKLVEQQNPDGSARYMTKNSPGKPTYPGQKQLYRVYDSEGLAQKDIICLLSESPPEDGTPLLRPVMSKGKRLDQPINITELQQHCRTDLSTFDGEYKSLEHPKSYSVEISPALEQARQEALKKR